VVAPGEAAAPDVGDASGPGSSPHASPLLALPLRYPVHVGPGRLGDIGRIVLSAAPAHRYAVISDETVAALHGGAVLASLPAGRTRLFTVPPGESEKTRERWGELTNALFDWGAGRDSTIIALGGGVIGDLAGFVAATFMRGVPVVQVPTTLLAMVDAAVGGKTGVDTPHGKNLVGAFHDPSAVVMDTNVLATLPPAVFRSGLAEMLKHGVVADAAVFDRVVAALPALAQHGASASLLPGLVADSVRIKASVVAQDAREGGLRQVLNFGHTIGHAIEHAMDYRMLHGEAVAVGMVVEARIAALLGIASAELALSIADALLQAGLPVSVPTGLDPDILVTGTRGDKKNRGGSVRYALPSKVGTMWRGDGNWSTVVVDDVAHSALLASLGS
jgi:3-dehydroquinate synthase